MALGISQRWRLAVWGKKQVKARQESTQFKTSQNNSGEKEFLQVCDLTLEQSRAAFEVNLDQVCLVK